MNQEIHPVKRLCRVMEVAKSGYYQWCKHVPSDRAKLDLVLTQALHRLRAMNPLHRTFGSPRMHDLLVKEGFQVGVKRVARLMRESKMQGSPRRR
ncbi:MAG: IS3 family transposase, partial [Gammaproteobacteria bacterium]|nr:IS3 family transposase [Gammaproteobacteria bacterium]